MPWHYIYFFTLRKSELKISGKVFSMSHIVSDKIARYNTLYIYIFKRISAMEGIIKI
jgi:hypothetical protein